MPLRSPNPSSVLAVPQSMKLRSFTNDQPFTVRQIVLWAVALTCAIEVVTLFARFGAGLESTVHTASTIGWLTGGLRIHHGYCGLVTILAAWPLTAWFGKWPKMALVAGWALLASDAIHHFLVLWPVTGSPQFDLFYPAP